jgi:hypothetical protein
LWYLATVTSNPPGYHIDESSISYNAYLIAQTGRDEYGQSWPLYFRAFNEYKNPVYIYVLAGLFKLTGPAIAVARTLSVVLGIGAALLLGVLGKRITKCRLAGLLVTLTALLTPWLFEMSRVVFEVAIYPLSLALYLICLQSILRKSKWPTLDILSIVFCLAIITYSYSIGRLLGPLLAIGLVIFVSRTLWISVLKTWIGYAITLIPLFLFWRRNPGALTGRFQSITWLASDRSFGEISVQFVKHFSENVSPWALFVTGDPDPKQVTHLYGSSLMLAATGLLILLGLYLIIRYKRNDLWWRYVIYGLAVSIVPASLTREPMHILRLAPVPVFLVVLTVPALEWLLISKPRRLALVFVIVLTLIQGVDFQLAVHADAHSVRRLNLFDAGYPEKIFAPAVASKNRPIYLADVVAIPGYIQAYWYGVLRRIPSSEFVRLPSDVNPPKGALVITTEETCIRCQIVATSDFYKLYIAGDPSPKREPLSEGGFLAGIRVINAPSLLKIRQPENLRVVVRNEGNSVWLGRDRAGGPLQVSLGNHWLNSERRMVTNDDGRSPLLADLRPGEEVELPLKVNAPAEPGDYLLEIDMLQEGVSWFGLKGSPTVKLRVTVE